MPPSHQSPKKVAIVQSNYIPWKGYFDLIHSVDEFILYDDVQFTKRDWRNRNQIKTSTGLQWLTIPVEVKGKFLQKIKDVKTTSSEWRKKHWGSLSANYGKAPYFKELKNIFEPLFLSDNSEWLSEINYQFTKAICEYLKIRTKISFSMDFEFHRDDKTMQLISLCEHSNANEYLSGPAAKDYLNEKLFFERGIRVHFFDYQGYPEYPQFHPPFAHTVTILDLLFHTGPNAINYMKSFGSYVEPTQRNYEEQLR